MEQQSSAEPASSQRTAELEDLRVRIGARLQLLFSRASRTTTLPSTLIGYLAPEFLIVKAPTESGLAVKVSNEEWLKVRLFNGIHLIEFDTTVRRQFVAPLSYWHPAYPTVVRTSTLRAAQRVRVDIAAHVETDGQPSLAEARIVDLTELGARIVAPAPLAAAESSIRIAFAVPLGSEVAPLQLSISAKIKSVKIVEGSPGAQFHAHGVQFDGLQEREKLILQSFVLLQLNEVFADGA